jgi:hypothetical protein
MRGLWLLAVVLVLSLSACSKSDTGPSGGNGATASAQLNWDQGNWNQANWQ